MASLNPVERFLTRSMQKPATIRLASRMIVTVTLFTVVVSGVLMRVFDHDEFPSIGLGLWWALQTVTTVGYGDIVPERLSGRIIAAFVMLEGVAFITIVAAAITSAFIERARRERAVLETEPPDHLRDVMTSLDERLHRIEKRLSEI